MIGTVLYILKYMYMYLSDRILVISQTNWMYTEYNVIFMDNVQWWRLNTCTGIWFTKWCSFVSVSDKFLIG